MTETQSQKKHLIALFAIWAGVIAGIRYLSPLVEKAPVLAKFFGSGGLTALLLVYPVAWWATRHGDRLDFLSIDLSRLKKDILGFLILILAVAVVLFPLNHFWQKFAFGFSYQSAGAHVSVDWATRVLVQVFVIAFPEEFFFRGIMQERLGRVWPAENKIFGVLFGKAVIVTSLIFAFSHSLIHLQWWHFSIFFPALAFAWLRERSGLIWGSVLFHAACNLFAQWVALHYH